MISEFFSVVEVMMPVMASMFCLLPGLSSYNLSHVSVPNPREIDCAHFRCSAWFETRAVHHVELSLTISYMKFWMQTLSRIQSESMNKMKRLSFRFRYSV